MSFAFASRVTSSLKQTRNRRMLVTISDSIKDSLKKAEVIPTVVPDTNFSPRGFLTISYGNDKEVTLGNKLKVAETQQRPRIDFTLNLPSDKPLQLSNKDLFTLVLTDPDAPTKGDEKWSEYCHYLSTDVQLVAFDSENTDFSAQQQLTTASLSGTDLFPYMGPGPPPKTGPHRYTFLLYKQKPGVEPKAPTDRPNWGTGIPGYGAAEYAEKYSLTLWAVNFFYAQNVQQ